jgi:hypothetical protein
MSRKNQNFASLRNSVFAALIAVTFLAIFAISGCANPPKSVSASAAATTVDPNDSTTLSATVTNDSSSKGGVTWSITGPGALSNQTSSSATYTAPAATNAAQSATITATSVADPTKSDPVNITVPAAVSVTTAALPGDLVGTAYSQALAASGGIPPYTWTIVTGTLPACLTMNSAGVISGTPTASCVGTATNLTFKATDSGAATPLSATSVALSLNVAPAPAIQLPAPGLLSIGVIGTPYNISLAATGGAGTLSYSISAGALPGGLTINAAGSIVGTPTAAGTFNFTVLASDAFGDSQTQSYSIKVNYPPVAIAPPGGALPVAFTGSAYSQSLTAGGGSGAGFVWTVIGLPADGITATPNGATLTISGNPTNPANISFTASVKDGAGNTSGPFNYTIAAYNPISIPATNPASLPSNTTINAAYTGTITATGGSGSGYTWTVTGLSDGLSSTNTGGTLTITGTPTTASTVTFNVSVKDSSGSSTGPIAYTITVNSVLTLPATNPATLPGNATTGTAYTGTITASGGSGTGYVFTVTGLPSNGISSAASAGTLTISGTPTTTGPVTFSVSIKDSFGNTAGPIAYTIIVYNPLVLPANPGTLPLTGTVNAAYTGAIVATGGSGSGYTFTVTGLSDGLTSASTGGTLTISGTPTSASSVTFQASVKDSAGNSAGPITYTVNIYNPLTLPATIPSTLPGNATFGVLYNGTVTASGGSEAGYVWTVTGLPNLGLSYIASGGVLVISGTPTNAGTVTVTVSLKDSIGDTAGPFTYTINAYNPIALPAPNPGTLPSSATVSVLYTGTIVASGGSGSGYTFTVTGLSDGLTSATSGNTLTISGTPTSASTVTFNASVKDPLGNTAGPTTYTVNVYAGLTLPAPNPASLGPGTINAAYSGTVTVGGGSGSGYVWTVTGFPANGLNYTTNGATLTITGTPTSTTAVSFNASVKDSANNTTGPITYTIPVNNSLTLPAPNPNTLPSKAYTGQNYSGTIVAQGGSGSGYVFTVTGLSDGLTSSSSGNTLTISGTLTSVSTVTFMVSVKDSAGNSAGPITYTTSVYNPLILNRNPNAFPEATVGYLYNGTLTVSGGSGSGYVWNVTGFTGGGLNYSTNGATLTVSGAPTSTTTVTFSASVTDSAGNTVGPFLYSIFILNTLQLPTPNPATLGPATVGSAYSGTIVVAGGSGNFTWTVTGLSDGLSYSTSGPTVTISGTPTSAATVSFNVTVNDTTANISNGPVTYNIQINSASSQVSGQIQYINNCGGASSLPQFTVKINTTPPQQTTTDSNGNYSFANVPDGTYTVTPSITGPSAVFLPASWSNFTVNNASRNGLDFQVALGYTVSGNVSYSGAKSGQVYLVLNSNGCGGSANTGTSIPFSAIGSGGAFTIHGVAPGTYTLNASIDNLGFGAANGSNPTGSTANLTVSNANLSGVAVTLTDPTLSAPSTAPKFNSISPTNLGAVIQFNAIKNNGIEAVTDYQLQWSTDSTFTSGINSEIFKAIGTGSNVWFLNNSTAGISGSFANGTSYYFRVRGELSAGNSPWAVWGGGTPTAVTIGAPTGGNTVTGTVTIPAGITPTGPLYAGFYDPNSGAVYADRIASPVVGANAYSVQVPTSTDAYINFGILDQNNDAIVDLGDVSNTDNSGSDSNGIIINSNLSNQNETLPSANSTPTVQTRFWGPNEPYSGYTYYQLNFDLREANKLPVAVQLISGPNVISPVDIGACGTCGHVQFQTFANLGGNIIPNVGDSYAFSVTYSDGSTETVNGLVTGWAGGSSIVGPSDLATNLAPVSNNSVSTTPTFTWTYPANASSYTYQFNLNDNNGNTIWAIPSNNSNLNGFPSSVTQIVWGTDPTGDTTNTPSIPSLNPGTTYDWQIQVMDANGNSAESAVYYIP